MPGLVPGIHVFLRRITNDVDGRDKPGHDGKCRRHDDHRRQTGAAAAASPEMACARPARAGPDDAVRRCCASASRCRSTFDIVTRTIGHPWLWLQEVTSTFFIYAIFIGAAVATRRNDHLYLTAVSEALHGTPRLIVEIVIRLVVLGVAFCLIWFGYINYPARLRQLPPAVDDADRLALRGDPALRRADRAVHDRAARQRHPQRLRPSRAAGRGPRRSRRSTPPRPTGHAP